MKIMFAITSQAHNLNKFAFLLNAVKDSLKQRLPRNLLFPSSDPTAIIQLKIDGAQLMIRLACLCPSLLCVCPAVLCSSHLLEVGTMGAPTRIQVSSIRWDRLGNINKLSRGNTMQHKSIKSVGSYKFACKRSGSETKMLSQKYHSPIVSNLQPCSREGIVS